MTIKGYGRVLLHVRDVSQALGEKIARIRKIAIGSVSLQGLELNQHFQLRLCGTRDTGQDTA